jgi:hypothetical protein
MEHELYLKAVNKEIQEREMNSEAMYECFT